MINTHLKVWVLKSLDDRYTSLWTKCEALFQKVNCLDKDVRSSHLENR